MINLFENFAKIVHFTKTLVYVFLTMLLLTVIFGYSHLSETILLFVLTGILWCAGFLIVDFSFSPRKGADDEELPSRVKSGDTSSNKSTISVVFLSIWFLLLIGFSVQLILQVGK